MLVPSLSFHFVAAFTAYGVVTTAASVTIDAGILNGGSCNSSSGASFYKGIPYAQSPTGDLRFAAPKAYSSNYPGGSLDASKDGPACVQFGTEFRETGPTSEDCLLLNIWVPEGTISGAGLPVRFWVYGGSNNAGGIANALYDGCNVAESGVILVSANYRLGPLGFLVLQNATIQGNQAYQDLLLALQWVQDNIEAFGGDPENVLLHGQSAGAINSFILATLPQAPQLFSSAIFESGGGRDIPFAPLANSVGQAYAQALNCSITDASCLRSQSLDNLVSVYQTLPITNSGFGHYKDIGVDSPLVASFGPFVDGAIIPTQPSEVGVQVPSVFGYNEEDGTLFVGNSYPDPTNLTAKDYLDFLNANFGPAGAAIISQYIPFSTPAFTATGFPGFAAIEYVYTAWQYQCPAYRGLNTAAQKGIPVWAYDFAHSPSCPWLQGLTPDFLPLLQAAHTAEIPFVFGNGQSQPVPNGTCNFSPIESALSQFMVSAWNSMAANQIPTDNATWPVYTGPQSSLGLTIANTTIPGYINFTVCDLFDQIESTELMNATASANSTSGGALPSGTGSSSPGTTAPISTGVATQIGTNAVGLLTVFCAVAVASLLA